MKLLSGNNTVDIAGIRLPRLRDDFEFKDKDNQCFVYENGNSSYDNIQQLALAVSCNRPVLLQGPVGSGKTCTVEYLAYVTGHRQPNAQESESVCGFVKVQLGEQTDSRMLLGGYQSTEIPGKFIWKPGVLTSAVLNGFWILLEDIDSTSSDVVTVIDNLIKNQSLSVPGFGDNIIPHPEFRLFATQRTLGSNSSFSVKNDMSKHWFVIQLKPLNPSELVGIICKRYPNLSCIANKMVSILSLEHPVQSSDRIPSARDLLKWCNRASKYFQTGNFDVSLRVLQDAVEIFCGYMDKDSSSMSEQIGLRLGIVKNKAFFLNPRYKPNISVTEKRLIAGRSSLDRRHSETVGLTRSKNMVFSLTAPSCRLIEKIACCLENNEPVLLVGETGCGKTTVLQHMAKILGRNLIVINMNQQSDTADLVGGFKPVTFRWIMKPLRDKFESLFRKLYDAEKNRDCLNKLLILFKSENWDVLLKFISYVQHRAVNLINFKISKYDKGDCKYAKWVTRLSEWEELGTMVKKYTRQCEVAEKSLVFSFIEGSLVKAVKRGDWVLLDEINLATSETLDCLSGLLEDSRGSLLLVEKGESKTIVRDSGFRLFAAMNPATDVGKKRLPVGLRNRFTEFFVEELSDPLDLYPLVESYLMESNYPPEKMKKIVNLYLMIKKFSSKDILDGSGKKPHYSLRNLCRALLVASKNLCGSAPRSLYEGLILSFLTQLDKLSYVKVHELLLRVATDVELKALLNQPIPRPPGKNCVQIEGFWLPVGNLQPFTPDNYILTDTVKRHLRDVIRIISFGSGIPILLQGDTSVGKTSLINYLAKCTGNFCARVNNHEHTDIQEYIGTYMADSNGKLVFKEGILCEAMRKGYWLILDELNLAPSEVLEALNRVLDDNRELYIPETQTVIKAHEKFMLFATQNPPGLYGGRKELSRAFKNRFIELHFGQIPADELITILEKRCQMPQSYCKKMVAVMTDLQLRRRGSEIFVGKGGFITLRDLFRWGERYRKCSAEGKFFDWEQLLADEGYILLAGRVRLPEESKIIEEVISKHFKRKTIPDNIFSLHGGTSPVSKKILESILAFSRSETEFKHVVWTYSMRRLAVLVCKAIEFSEPVLLVGETGCGKTTVVQILSLLRNQDLYSVNCHTHSESADFLGGLRPVREESRTKGKLFEWCDGPLVRAMKTGSFFLADEISLADDSVLERLNSLLEPERTILLTEKGGELMEGETEEHATKAEENFQFVGTMNPGGDYGKKELSPALRNRFTEIWVEVGDNKRGDYKQIIEYNLKKVEEEVKSRVAEAMVDFVEWFQTSELGRRVVISVRDVMTWIEFMNASDLEWFRSCLHGCCLTFLDGLGCGSLLSGNPEAVNKFRRRCLEFLAEGLNGIVPLPADVLKEVEGSGGFVVNETSVAIQPFSIARGRNDVEEDKFFFNAPTTFTNTLRLLRGLQMKKAILLEGSPGVGKTSLVSSLAKASGHTLTRINLSDQTDISDLFGADLPEEGATAGNFAWRDGPFLSALKSGHWILLDELNLALQSVLEGLNAVLDHRGHAFIPELNKTFYISDETKLFACQNPLKEGGNRRGLPKSFLNRFTQVYVEQLSESDYVEILRNSFPEVAAAEVAGGSVIGKMVEFNGELGKMIGEGKMGASGGPWELNLRDITRWVEGLVKSIKKGGGDERVKKSIFNYAELLYVSRFRSKNDADRVLDLFQSVFGFAYPTNTVPKVFVTEKSVLFGDERMERDDRRFCGDLNEFEMFGSKFGTELVRLCRSYRGKKSLENLRLLRRQHRVLTLLWRCVHNGWLPILVGDRGTGKTCCVRVLAALANRKLRIFSCNSATDTTEILGGFEQTDFNRHLDDLADSCRTVVLTGAMLWLKRDGYEQCLRLLDRWLIFTRLPVVEDDENAASAFLKRLDCLGEMMRCEALDLDPETKAKGEELSLKLNDLRRHLAEEEGLTAGGKFEWVDSVLIKSMEEGSWLLMEDVNLCSSAVLDRLNCLLEPNGCLTIGERGARADGSLFTIRPHPDFRLFFTMNPRNGPISRAMRNRGVEICLMGDAETKTWPVQDRLVMLSDVGIPEMAMQNALSEFENTRDSPNISDLVSNAFWTGQYVNHGFDKSEAFIKSTRQVYKLSSEDAFEIVKGLSLGLGDEKSYSISYARPSLNDFFIDDGHARLKQSSALLVFLKETLMNHGRIDNVPVEDLEYFIGKRANLKISDGIIYSILFVYMLSAGPSATRTRKFLSGILKDVEWGGWHKYSEVLADAISDPAVIDKLVELPWDTRWYIDPKAVVPIKSKLTVLLKFVFLLFRESKTDPNLAGLKKKETVTVSEYSKAVRLSYLEDVLMDYPVLGLYNTILDSFDDFVSGMKSAEVVLDDEQVLWLLNAFKWRFWLGTMANSTLLVGKKKIVKEETLTQVDLYFLWFSHYILQGVNFTGTTAMDRYLKLVGNVKLALRNDVSLELLKLSNAFRRCLGHPPPEKYLPKETSPMEIDESKDFGGDSAVMKLMLNNFVQYFHACFITRSRGRIGFNALSAVDEFPKSLLEEYEKGSAEISSEIMYHCLGILNSEYEFFDEFDGKEEMYSKQVLPFHRPVLTCRVTRFLFCSPEKWSMTNYRNSEKELRDLAAAVLPLACSVQELDPRANEWLKLSNEMARVEEHLKNCLGTRDLSSFLAEKLRQNLSPAERKFFEKVSAVTTAISAITVRSDSELYVYGCAWVLLGFLEAIVLQGAKIDPVRKKMLKAKCAKAEVEDLEAEIKVFELNVEIVDAALEHPYICNLKDRFQASRRKMLKYTNLERANRDPEKFRELTMEINSFVDVTEQAIVFCGGVLESVSDREHNEREHQIFCGKARFIRNKTRHFLRNVKKKFVECFGDLAYPLLGAAAQVEHGVNLITSELFRKRFPEDIKAWVNDFCMFPIPAEQSRHPFHILGSLPWCPRIREILEKEKLALLFASCRIKCNEWLVFKTEEKYRELINLFAVFVEFWKREEEKRLLKKQEEESLYLKRGVKKCETKTEEEELDEEQEELFPTYENEMEGGVAEPEESLGASLEDLFQITRMHTKSVKEGMRLSWLSKESTSLPEDYLTPLRLRYLLLSRILPRISFALGYETDSRLLPGLLPLIHAKESDSLSTQPALLVHDDNIYDFYKDKNVPEAEKCSELLADLKIRCGELLEQWPEHPALVQMNVVIDRILSFPIESPLMKFLTGLEMLLQSCQHWESVAHSGVSISEHLVRLTNLIIEWRKLELQGWKNCFLRAHFRIKMGACKWWYHIWSLVEEYLQEKTSLSDILQTLYGFVEASPIGEFETRLDILLSFHCHLTRLGPSGKTDKLAVSLWNLYTFYNQYSGEVAKKLETLSAPVLKKLKDYVSIAKWNDITYWSVKQAIHKSHRSLLKFIKEYEGILKQPVQLSSMDPHSGLGKEKSLMTQDINQFLENIKANEELKSTKKLLSITNLDKKFEKAKEFCRSIVLTGEYPNLVLQLEFLSEQICESTEHFRDLDVDRGLTKEEQKSQAKSIVHQKRRALADLFKHLRTIGLSYQTGNTLREFGVLELCDTAPMVSSERKSGEKLTGEDYYLKTVSRRLVLENSLLAPSKEIGPPVIERLRGYASHIMDLNKRQKSDLSKMEGDYKRLQRLENVLADLTESDEGTLIPDPRTFAKASADFKRILGRALYGIEQFRIILDSWPGEGDKMKKMNFLPGLTPQIMISSTFESEYASAREKLEDIRGRLRKMEKCLESVSESEITFSVEFTKGSFVLSKDEFSFRHKKHVERFNSLVEEFEETRRCIREFKLIFVGEGVKNCLVEILDELGGLECEKLETGGIECKSVGNLEEEDVCGLVENILLIIQKMLKKFRSAGNEGKNRLEGDGSDSNVNCPLEVTGDEEEEEKEGQEGEEEEEEVTDLLENHLTKRLVDSLESDVKDLKMELVNKHLSSLFEKLTSLAAEEGSFALERDAIRSLRCVLPFIKQYSLLSFYFLEQRRMCYRSSNKLSSILAGTFIQIAQKGFCIPPEYEEEEGEGVSNQAGGLGLGEGEGKRDVSDRIESEDQLEGAEVQGKEKEKEEEKDCKEEEKGIEMSEDFEGKAQDIEKKDDEENEDEDSEEEEEPDVKEMGETEEGVDKLEKELWSSDEEEEEGDDKKEETGSGQGKQTTENKYAGKEDEEGEEEQDGTEEEKEEKRKEDIDEINEQEDNGDQIDPYHGHHQPEPEVEPFDLPDNLNLDDGEEKDKEEEEGEKNPFDIDAMKEVQPPNESEEKENEGEAEKNEQEMEEDSSEGEGDEKTEEEAMEVDENGEEKVDDGEIEKKESAAEEKPEEEKEKEGEEKEEKSRQEFQPSDDKPSTEPAQPAPESEKDELASKDEIAGKSKQPEFKTEAQEVTEKPKEENKGTGQAEIENMSEGHEVGESNKEKVQPGEYRNEKERKQKRERPGKSDEDRTLAENDLNVRKKAKTFDGKEKKDEDEGNEGEMEGSDIYEHVKEKIEKAHKVIDAATNEQAESQPVPNKEEEEGGKVEDEDMAMDVDEEKTKEEDEEVEEMEPSRGQKVKDLKKNDGKGNEEGKERDEDVQIEVEGEIIQTLTVERGPVTTYHTRELPSEEERVHPLPSEQIRALRLQIQEQIEAINQSEAPLKENVEAWQLLNSVVEDLSRDLTEQLRLILEPTKATRLKGDYRTGRRINMRKIISYIASEFRKDNIWLRRTKPWKREHEIVVAIDDSSSMAHNNSKELAFESLALVSKALSLVEAGRFGVVSFGERTRVLHPLGDPFTEETGAKLLKEFTFEEKKTLISEMLDASCSMMRKGGKKEEISRLLVIISDGRGVFSEGLEKVKFAVRRALDQGIFIVFVIIDEPSSKDSIMDIRMPEFKNGSFQGIKSYLEEFPFPYYLILRDIEALPNVLGDALRQWFQLIASTSPT